MPVDPPEEPTALPGVGLFRVAALFYLGLALAGVVWLGVGQEPLPLETFFELRRLPQDVLLGVAAGLMLVGAWRGLRGWPLARRLEARLEALLSGIRADEALGLALLSGLAEEVFFRGAVQSAWGYPAATILFGLLHTGRGREMLVWTAAALAAGAVLGALVLWRGNLAAAIVAHVLVNAVQLRRLAGQGRR